MASDSGSNMDREMILADFQVGFPILTENVQEAWRLTWSKMFIIPSTRITVCIVS